jgi:hypothetical protein
VVLIPSGPVLIGPALINSIILVLRMGDIFIYPSNFPLGEYRATLVRLSFPLSRLLPLIVDLFQSSKTVDSAPVFKFLYLIVGPTFFWIKSTVSANPTGTNAMTFGQARKRLHFCDFMALTYIHL